MSGKTSVYRTLDRHCDALFDVTYGDAADAPFDRR
jgi:hypothetical protein